MTKKQGGIIITLLLISMGFLFFSIFKPAQTWEYKHITLTAERNSRTGTGAFSYSSIQFSDSYLNALGNCGWELVDSYLEMETAFPNFGKDDFVTGLQPNIRPQCLVLIFKRPCNLLSAFSDGFYNRERTLNQQLEDSRHITFGMAGSALGVVDGNSTRVPSGS